MACVSAGRRVHRAELMPLAHRILRAMRRAFRSVTMHALLLARALGLWTALPCAPWHLPKSGLSEKLRPLIARFRDPATRTPGLLARIHAAFLDGAGEWRRWTAR